MFILLNNPKARRAVLFSFCSIIVLSSYVFGAFTVEKKLFPYEIFRSFYSKYWGSLEDHKLDKEWASKLSEGGYILHFRHAQREKWPNVTAFDAYELYSRVDAEKSSFAKATCLTPQGVEEAKLIGKIFAINTVKISKIISSPSCRSKQTAFLAFGKVDLIDNSLLHRTAIMRDQWDDAAKQLRKLLVESKPELGKNIVLLGHGGTLGIDKLKVLDRDDTNDIDGREETGFIVLENIGGKLYARHKFNSFKDYVNASLRLPMR
jgi:broad specificity phosphatase PhoE